MDIVDKSKDTNLGGFTLFKPTPAPGQCPECAVVHPKESPHYAYGLFYQMRFKEEHGRWPSWIDAMAHCSEEIKKAFSAGLKKAGVDVNQPNETSLLRKHVIHKSLERHLDEKNSQHS